LIHEWKIAACDSVTITRLFLRCEAVLSLAIQALMPETIEDPNDVVSWFTLKQVADIIEADVVVRHGSAPMKMAEK
jgi:hypothetical protein